MLKKNVIILLMLFIGISLSACTSYPDAGIVKNWYFEDEWLEFDDVEGAIYYQLIFLGVDGEMDLLANMYEFRTYESNYDFYRFQDNDYRFKIRVFFSDLSYEDSEMIEISIERIYPHPLFIGGQYIRNPLSWDPVGMNDSRFIDYTLIVDDEEFAVEENEYELNPEIYTSGVYEIYVIVNYEGGSSLINRLHYEYWGLEYQSINAYYDMDSNIDFTYDLDLASDVLAVYGPIGYYSNQILPETVVDFEEGKLTLSKYYIQTEAKPELSDNTIYLSLYILTATNVYTFYLTNFGTD